MPLTPIRKQNRPCKGEFGYALMLYGKSHPIDLISQSAIPTLVILCSFKSSPTFSQLHGGRPIATTLIVG